MPKTTVSTSATTASDTTSKHNSMNMITSAAAGGTPASASTRKRAGSAPERAGVSAAPKSPPSTVRTDVVKPSGTPIDRALIMTLRPRDAISSAVTANSSRCTRDGRSTSARSAGQLS